jgi:hypothetical protein
MKLISDIINELVDSEKSISSPLLKTKVLASRLQNHELLSWVNNELGNYTDSMNLPEYRKFGCHINGVHINGNTKYTNQPVLVGGLGKEIEKILTTIEFFQSISTLENMLTKNGSGTLELALSAETTNIIQNNIRRMGNPYYQLLSAKKVIGISVVSEMLSTIRNKLLDFMLKLDEDFGNLTEIEELKTKQNEILNIMSQTIIHTSGDGNVVNTGDNSKLKVTIKISKGNKEELRDHLLKNGINENDTNELIEIIDTETPNELTKKFGEKVNTWITKVLGKALNGTWEIGIGTASTMIAEALNSYYGI